jgi:hypothetical protein
MKWFLIILMGVMMMGIISATNIILQTANTINKNDVWTAEFDPETYKDETSFRLGSDNASANDKNIYLMFNVSSIPEGAIIQEATLNLYLTTNQLDANDILNTSVYFISNNTWLEEETNWNNAPTRGAYSSSLLFRNTTLSPIDLFSKWDISPIFNLRSNTLLSLSVQAEEIAGIGSSTDDVYFRSKEYAVASQRPYLNITYTTEAPANCWTKTGNVLFIPTGCLYQLDMGVKGI